MSIASSIWDYTSNTLREVRLYRLFFEGLSEHGNETPFGPLAFTCVRADVKSFGQYRPRGGLHCELR